MSFPNFPNKYSSDSYVSPDQAISHFHRESAPWDGRMPHSVIFCYQGSLLGFIGETENVKALENPACELYLLERTDGKVGVAANFGLGAPAASTVMEELIALGVRRFITVGTAGALQARSAVGDVIVCDRAIRDEGVSHHYLAPSPYVTPSPGLTERLEDEIIRLGIPVSRGATWTTDAPYRQTVDEVKHYRCKGIMTVEMEAAALFAVAEYRKVDIAGVFVVSDSLAEHVWQPGYSSRATRSGLEHVFPAAVAAALPAD